MRRVKLVHLASLKTPPADKLKKLTLARAKLLKHMVAFGDLLAGYYSLLVPIIQSRAKDIDTQQPEQSALPLPSSFTPNAIEAAGFQDAAAIKRTLREGQAHDCLEDVRCSVLTYNHIAVVKSIDVTGQRAHTRGLALQRTQMNGARDATRLYNHNRRCMISLGMGEKDPELQELKETELWCWNVGKARNLGPTRPDPWYWSIGRPSDESEEEEEKWKLESRRAKWFRDRAALDRWKEEQEILEAEYLRINTLAAEYETLAEAKPPTDRERAILLGYVVYAWKQGRVYATLREDVESEWALREKLKRRKTKWDKLKEADALEEKEGEGEEGEEWEDTDDFSYLDEELVVEED
ncbi:hypothetical protein AAF712_002563 [Marasmius tenuissimus]|uniref:Uncharacterized protein n=1 Tax=Marasmius tenuissimus TaxID=585030 RepID=A0ABR3AAH4_9AGAR